MTDQIPLRADLVGVIENGGIFIQFFTLLLILRMSDLIWIKKPEKGKVKFTVALLATLCWGLRRCPDKMSSLGGPTLKKKV